MERARVYRGHRVIPARFAILTCVEYVFASHDTNAFFNAFVLNNFNLFLLIQFHARGINRRLDAFNELLESDRSEDA